MDTARIVALCKKQGKSMTHLCNLIGKGRGYIKDVRYKDRDMPEEYLQAIAADLGTTPEYLRGETDIVTPPRDTDGLTSEDLADITIDDDMIVFHRDGKTTKIKMPSDRIAEIEKIAQVLANGGNTDDL